MRDSYGKPSTDAIITAAQAAHLIPVDMDDWFLERNMWIYTSHRDPADAVNDSTNGVYLKPDLHMALDHQKLVFYPKDGEFVPHFLSDDMLGEARSYHNVPTSIGPGIAAHLIYGRFAFNIISKTQKFVKKWRKTSNPHRMMLVDFEAISGSSRRSAGNDSQASKPSGSKSARSTRSSSRRENPEAEDGGRMVQLSRILSSRVWEALSAEELRGIWHERGTSGGSGSTQTSQRIVPASESHRFPTILAPKYPTPR
jgi:hypothetical protein